MNRKLSLNVLLFLLVAGVLIALVGYFEISSPPPASQVIISMEPGSFRIPESKCGDTYCLGFLPKTVVLVIGVNNTVMWKNDDSDVHTAHSNIPEFDSGILQPGMTYTHTFLRPGKFAYHCDPHPWMTGLIVVKER